MRLTVGSPDPTTTYEYVTLHFQLVYFVILSRMYIKDIGKYLPVTRTYLLIVVLSTYHIDLSSVVVNAGSRSTSRSN